MYKNIFKFTLLVSVLCVVIYYGTKETDALISNGANAVDMLGQYDGTSSSNPVPKYSKGSTNNAPFLFGFGAPRKVAVDSVNHRLFVADSSNGRVLVYNMTVGNTITDYVPDFVIGQADFATADYVTTQNRLTSVASVVFDSLNNRLFVADANSARVMVYDVSTITNGMNASYVIGQPDFVSSNDVVSQSGLKIGLNGLAYDTTGERLFVADSARNAILIYDVSAGNIANGMNASNILGRPDFVTTGFTVVGNNNFSNNSDMAYDSVNNRLFVADSARHRVLAFDLSTLADGMAASYVLGQSNFTGQLFASNQINSIQSPRGLAYDSANSLLYVSGYDRVLVFDVSTGTIANGQNASNVLGKANFTASGGTTSANELTDVFGVTLDPASNMLYAVDGNRVAVFDVSIITDGEAMVNLLGMYDGTNQTNPVPDYNKPTSGENDSPNEFGFAQATVATYDNVNHRLFVADGSNSRVLVYNLNSSNQLLDHLPDAVLGQPSFARKGNNVTQTGLNNPQGLAYDPTGNRLFVADSAASRVLVYDVSSITNGEAAVNVLGQTIYTSNSSNASQTELNYPTGLSYDTANSRLYVTDQGNNRIMIFDVASITDGEAAINVLGQANFTSSGGNASQTELNYPTGVAYSSALSQVFVADSSNNRVVVFDVSSITDGEAAINVLGQANFTSTGSNVSQTEMNFPTDVTVDDTYKRLFVADFSNSRTLVFDVSSITDGEAAINVLGQPDYITNTQAKDQSHAVPYGLGYDSVGSRLAVMDSTYSRMMIFDVATTTTVATPAPSSSGGSGGGGFVAPAPQYYNGNTYVQGSPTSTPSTTTTKSNSSTIFQSTGNSVVGANAHKFNELFKQNNLPDLIGGGEPGVPKEFSNYVCERYLREYILPEKKNNPNEVNKLQIFLNESEGEKLTVDGTYDEDDILAVKRFQAKYLDQIMAPWGVDEPTGRVFRTTTAKVNLMMCAKNRGCPYFKEYLNKGDESLEAVKVQDFLNVIFAPTSGYPDNALPLTKTFNSPTKATVENFQNVYKEIVLKPWDLASATGRWYQTTRHAANRLMNCNEGDIKLDNGKSFR